MTVATYFNLNQQLVDLKTTYQNISTTNCELFFQLQVSKSIKILSYLLQFVRNKRNIFSCNITTNILIYIFSFLSKENMISNFTICKNWNSILINFSKNKQFSKLAINRPFVKYLLSNEVNCIIKSNDKYVYIPSYSGIKYYNNCLESINTINVRSSLFATNNRFLCYYEEKSIKLYSFYEEKTVRAWNSSNSVIGLAICEKYFYFADSKNFLNICDFDGHILKKWKLKTENMSGKINIGVNKNEIFLIDSKPCIQVFSFDGILLREIKCYNNYLKQLYVPEDIAISNKTIYVTTKSNKQILVFNCNGDFISQISCNNPTNNITCFKEYLLVSNKSDGFVSVYDLSNKSRVPWMKN